MPGHFAGDTRPQFPRVDASELESDLAKWLNRHSVDDALDTPDFVLAKYLIDCLAVWDRAHGLNERWHGR